MKALMLFLTFLSWTCAADTVIKHQEYCSPNKTYVVQVSVRDKDSILAIKNEVSGEIELSTNTLLTPILDVRWAPHSDSIIVIQHLAGGSTATLFHYVQHSRWVSYDCGISLNVLSKSSVVGVKFFNHIVQLNYALALTTKNGAITSFQSCFLEVDDNTGVKSIKNLRSISKNTFIKLRKKEEENWK